MRATAMLLLLDGVRTSVPSGVFLGEFTQHMLVTDTGVAQGGAPTVVNTACYIELITTFSPQWFTRGVANTNMTQ